MTLTSPDPIDAPPSDDARQQFAAALARCESEPIHLIGAIQPHGYLLAFDADWRLRLASANTAALLRRPVDALIDTPVAQLLGDEVSALLARQDVPATWQLRLPCRLTIAGRHQRATLWLHRSGALYVCEIDTLRQQQTTLEEGQEVITRLVRRLDQEDETRNCCHLLAGQFRELTGFDRVLIYRFDEHWDGEVIAESRNDKMPSLLGNHFPASDIPAQARALYTTNLVRALGDTESTPVPLVGAQSTPFDMSLCVLRSMSPIHVEYLRNMGARAALSVSLMMDGQLQGLIACHHATPRRLSLRQMALVELAGRAASLKLTSLEHKREVAYLDRIRRVLGRLTDLFTKTQDTEAVSQLLEQDILSLVGATGCLLITPDKHFVAGRVPGEAHTADLVAWLNTVLASQRVFATDHLAAHWPAGAAMAADASGLLALNLAPGRQLSVVWFREEIIRDIPWAGQPQKTAIADAQGVRIEPRRSFAQWVETVRGKSRRWEAIEIDAATTISHALQAVFTERSLWSMEHELRVTAESANRLKGQFLGNISHELRTPLHGILAFGSVCMKRLNDVPPEKLRQYLENIMTSANRLNHLVDELLNLAQLQSGKVSVRKGRMDMAILLNTVIHEMKPVLDGRSLSVTVSVECADTQVHADSLLLGRVLHHLLANAQKFSPVGSKITVRLRDGYLSHSQGTRPAVQCDVLDDGPGIPESELSTIFENFTQSTRTYRGDGGSGLGLAICREIVTLHKGFIGAENRPEGGACISCLLPRD